MNPVYFRIRPTRRLRRLGRPEWIVQLIATNGEPVFTSEPYTTKGSAVRFVATLRRTVAQAHPEARIDGEEA